MQFLPSGKNKVIEHFPPGKVVWIELRLQQYYKNNNIILMQECEKVLQITCRTTRMVLKGLNLEKNYLNFILSCPVKVTDLSFNQSL